MIRRFNAPQDFTQFVAIDWSGAVGARQAGIAVAMCDAGRGTPTLIAPPSGRWSRQAVLDWLVQRAETGTSMLIGMDLSPAFPFVDKGAYFPGWQPSPPTASALWACVDMLCADDPNLAASSFVSHPQARRHFRQFNDCGDLFPGGRGRFRVCEHGQAAMQLSPYSCFNLVGAAQVGKSSLTGMRVLNRLRGIVPVWPFDPLPASGPVIVEIYTSLAARAAGLRKGISKIRDGQALDAALAAFDTAPHAPLARYDDHSTDAILTAAWLRRAAVDPAHWSPAALSPHIARTEGWTFGVI